MAAYQDARTSEEKRVAIAQGIVLREQGLSWQQISEATGVPNSTMRYWHETVAKNPAALETVREHIKAQASFVAAKGMELIAERMPKMDDGKLIAATGMATDKLALLTKGQDTGAGAHGLDRVLDALAKTGGKVTLEVEPTEPAIDVTPKEGT